jgi:hypothetical protein
MPAPAFRIITFITGAVVARAMLAHPGEATSPAPLMPAGP